MRAVRYSCCRDCRPHILVLENAASSRVETNAEMALVVCLGLQARKMACTAAVVAADARSGHLTTHTYIALWIFYLSWPRGAGAHWYSTTEWPGSKMRAFPYPEEPWGASLALRRCPSCHWQCLHHFSLRASCPCLFSIGFIILFWMDDEEVLH